MAIKYRIIVAGTRDFNNYEMLNAELSDFLNNILDDVEPQSDIEFISGTANGADALGEKFARSRGYSLRLFPAYWNKYGKAAGPIRNKQMAEYASEEHGVLFAFWDGKSRGSKNMIELANTYGLEVHIVQYC